MKRTSTGFTLIELLMVVAILGIIAAVAVPIYEGQKTKHRRAEGIIALTKASQALERYNTVKGSYTDDLTDLDLAALGLNSSGFTERGYYQIALSIPPSGSVACTVGAKYYCYTLTATPKGVQAGDADCTTMTLDHTGKRAATGGGASGCWAR